MERHKRGFWKNIFRNANLNKSESGQKVGSTKLFLGGGGKSLENHIANVMTERIIDGFKMVQIEEADTKADVVSLGKSFLSVEHHHYVPSVVKTCEVVGDGHVFDSSHGGGQFIIALV